MREIQLLLHESSTLASRYLVETVIHTWSVIAAGIACTNECGLRHTGGIGEATRLLSATTWSQLARVGR